MLKVSFLALTLLLKFLDDSPPLDLLHPHKDRVS